MFRLFANLFSSSWMTCIYWPNYDRTSKRFIWITRNVPPSKIPRRSKGEIKKIKELIFTLTQWFRNSLWFLNCNDVESVNVSVICEFVKRVVNIYLAKEGQIAKCIFLFFDLIMLLSNLYYNDFKTYVGTVYIPIGRRYTSSKISNQRNLK